MFYSLIGMVGNQDIMNELRQSYYIFQYLLYFQISHYHLFKLKNFLLDNFFNAHHNFHLRLFCWPVYLYIDHPSQFIDIILLKRLVLNY